MSSRDRDFRLPRRRSFDDDNYEPPFRNFGYAPPNGPQFEAPSGPAVQAIVKWYNPDKGLGFVELASVGGDAFLHASVLERGGHGTVPPGATHNATKGCGFIAADPGGKDIFVHASALDRSGVMGPAEGQRVAVDVADGQKGPEAVGVRLV